MGSGSGIPPFKALHQPRQDGNDQPDPKDIEHNSHKNKPKRRFAEAHQSPKVEAIVGRKKSPIASEWGLTPLRTGIRFLTQVAAARNWGTRSPAPGNSKGTLQTPTRDQP